MIAGVMLLLAQVVAQQPAGEPAKGVIEGTVVNQLTTAPIRKAVVRLGGARGAPMSAVTDASGRFVFRGLPAGDYWVMADAEDYRPDTESGTPQPSRIKLAGDEHKAGIELPLVPLAGISGRVRDEYGEPVAGCSVTATQYQYVQGERRLEGRGGVITNDRGEYQLSGLQPGRYYLFLRCTAQFAAPHPLLRSGDPRIRYQTYPPQFYPGVPDLNGAASLAVTPGSALKGVDFGVRRINAAMLSGRVTGTDANAGGYQVTLYPQSSSNPEWASYNTGIDRRTNKFVIPAVVPGSYLLVLTAFGEGPARGLAMLPLEIGDASPEPVEVPVSAPRVINGTLEMERENIPKDPRADPQRGTGKAQISLSPLGRIYLPAPPPATVSDDGAFTLTGLLPGRWRLNLMNVPGYIKTFTIGDQEVPPFAFEIGAGTAGAWRIVAGRKTGTVEASISDTLPADRGTVSVLLVPDNPRWFGAGLERAANPGEKGSVILSGVRPGRYRLYAVETRSYWVLQQRPDVLQSFAGRGEVVDVAEDGRVQVTLGLIRADELKRAMQEGE